MKNEITLSKAEVLELLEVLGNTRKMSNYIFATAKAVDDDVREMLSIRNTELRLQMHNILQRKLNKMESEQ